MLGRLKQLTKTKGTATAAKQLHQRILEAPCQLLEDEVHLCKSLGIKTSKGPTIITLYEESGRISVRWEALVNNQSDVVRFALLAPPNDRRKRTTVLKWLRRYPDLVRTTIHELEREGFSPKPPSEWEL